MRGECCSRSGLLDARNWPTYGTLLDYITVDVVPVATFGVRASDPTRVEPAYGSSVVFFEGAQAMSVAPVLRAADGKVVFDDDADAVVNAATPWPAPFPTMTFDVTQAGTATPVAVPVVRTVDALAYVEGHFDLSPQSAARSICVVARNLGRDVVGAPISIRVETRTSSREASLGSPPIPCVYVSTANARLVVDCLDQHLELLLRYDGTKMVVTPL